MKRKVVKGKKPSEEMFSEPMPIARDKIKGLRFIPLRGPVHAWVIIKRCGDGCLEFFIKLQLGRRKKNQTVECDRVFPHELLPGHADISKSGKVDEEWLNKVAKYAATNIGMLKLSSEFKSSKKDTGEPYIYAEITIGKDVFRTKFDSEQFL